VTDAKTVSVWLVALRWPIEFPAILSLETTVALTSFLAGFY
jgi:hypothetical protein